MGWLLLLAIFLVVLSRRGRMGPFLWDPPCSPALTARAAPGASSFDSAERILAQRYADGDLTTDEYYERLSLLQTR